MKRVIFFGDVVGRPGRSLLAEKASALREEHGADFLVANAENAAAGAGLTGKIANQLLSAGLDGLTLGDHVWDQKAFAGEIDSLDRVCRPANLAAACPGRRWLVFEKEGFRLGLFTVLGRTFMPPREDPFAACDRVLEELKGLTDAVIVEVHAEATSEKIALGWHLDGRAAAVVGTHTHVPTADAEVRPGGTAFLTDIGMCGPYRSVLGREVEPVLAKYLDGMPRRFEVATEDVRLSAAVIDIDEETGLSHGIRLLTLRAGK